MEPRPGSGIPKPQGSLFPHQCGNDEGPFRRAEPYHEPAGRGFDSILCARIQLQADHAPMRSGGRLHSIEMNVLAPLSERRVNGVFRIDYRPGRWNAFSFAANVANSLAPNGKLIAEAASNGGVLGIRNTREDPRFFKAHWTTAPDPAGHSYTLGPQIKWACRITRRAGRISGRMRPGATSVARPADWGAARASKTLRPKAENVRLHSKRRSAGTPLSRQRDHEQTHELSHHFTSDSAGLGEE